MTSELPAELEPLLTPLAGPEACGPSMRFDPVFTEIRLAREEDDPSLPMRQWERPLKKADWALIVDRCSAVLSKQSKDLQVAAWLLEAWTRQKGFPGLEKGLRLMYELCEDYWECLHPRIDEDGDSDARVAPLQWLNESMSLTVRVQVQLVNMGARKPARITMAEWERLTAEELSGSDGQTPPPQGEDAPVTRGDVLAKARGDKTGTHAQQLQMVRASIAHLDTLNKRFGERLGLDAPNLGKLRNTLEAIERVLLQFQPAVPVADAAEPAMDNQQTPSGDGPAPINYIPREVTPVNINGIHSRDEAYNALERIAEFLEKTEPHSPTPYLIRRAVNWGRMPLPELMQEIMREEGDLNRMTTLLGLNR